MTAKRRGRPAKAVISTNGPYSIVEKSGVFILYHGASVRHVFKTRQQAEEYLSWLQK